MTVTGSAHNGHTRAVAGQSIGVVKGKTTVLDSLDLNLTARAVTGILGPSGCGKTTLLRAIAGVQIHTGELTVLGRPAGHASLRSQIGYAAQGAAVYSDLTVAENVRYFGEVLGDAQDDGDHILERVGLTAQRNQIVGQLSGGQRARVNLAIALLGRPRLLLLDEPTVGLDPILGNELWQMFHDLARGGITLIVSSHVMDEAARCDELLLMRAGAVLAHTSASELRQRARTDDLEKAFLQASMTLIQRPHDLHRPPGSASATTRRPNTRHVDRRSVAAHGAAEIHVQLRAAILLNRTSATQHLPVRAHVPRDLNCDIA